MTRKDYILIAAALYAAKPRDKDVTAIGQATWLHTVEVVAQALVGTNDKYDKKIFLKACGVD